MLHADKVYINMLIFTGEKMTEQLAEYFLKSPDMFSILINVSTTSNKACLIIYISIPFQNEAWIFFKINFLSWMVEQGKQAAAHVVVTSKKWMRTFCGLVLLSWWEYTKVFLHWCQRQSTMTWWSYIAWITRWNLQSMTPSNKSCKQLTSRCSQIVCVLRRVLRIPNPYGYRTWHPAKGFWYLLAVVLMHIGDSFVGELSDLYSVVSETVWRPHMVNRGESKMSSNAWRWCV